MKTYNRFFIYLFVVLFMGLIVYCAGGRITVDQSYEQLRPVKPLELPEQVNVNLVVILDNVANETDSYKNYVELFINDKKVEPNWLVTNVQDKYVYRLRVRPGYYDVRAKYIAYVGWGEEDYEIKSRDLVRVQHDKKMVVECSITKHPNGTPVNTPLYFETRTEEFSKDNAMPTKAMPPRRRRR